MPGSGKTVREYLDELEDSRKDKSDQVRDALDIYVDMWRKAIERGVIEPGDEIGAALAKIDELGGLNQVAEG